MAMAAATLVLPSSAQAITYGAPVPARNAPWLLTVWYAQDSTDAPVAACEAVAISAREVLTTAGCVIDKGFYFLGATPSSKLSSLIAVEAVAAHRGYRESTIVHDIAVLRPLTPLKLRAYARLGTLAQAAAVRGKRPPALTVYGYGKNAAGKTTGKLNALNVVPLTSKAKGSYRNFNPKLQLAVGKKVKNKIGGLCDGDTGAPLIMRSGKVAVVVGVGMGWDSRGCSIGPSAFTSVGNYAAWLKAARASLPKIARAANRALPEAKVLPGFDQDPNPAIGTTIGCLPGTWSANTRSVVVTWLRDGVAVETATGAPAVHTWVAADAGRKLTCAVTATSHAGTQLFTSPEVAVPTAPDVFAKPSVAGLPTDSSEPAPGTVATCTAPAETAPNVTFVFDWFVSATYDVPAGATPVASGAALTLTPEVLKAISPVDQSPNYLVCRVTKTNSMGTVATVQVSSFPSLHTPAPSATLATGTPSGKPVAGTTMSCTAGNVKGTVTYRWARATSYLSGSGPLPAAATVIAGAVGATYVPTPADTGTGKYVLCEVTDTTWYAAGADYASSF